MLDEFYRIEHHVTTPGGESCRTHVRYALERGEISRALTVSDRRRQSPARVAIESGVVSVIGILCLVNYFTDPARTFSTLLIGLMCFLLAAVALLYSPISIYFLAKQEAQKQKKVNLWLMEDRIGFGKNAERYISRPYDEIYGLTDKEDLLLLIPQKDVLIAVPRQALPEEDWDFLREQVREVRSYKQIAEQQKGKRV